MRFILLLILLTLITGSIIAQNNDSSLHISDTLNLQNHKPPDSANKSVTPGFRDSSRGKEDSLQRGFLVKASAPDTDWLWISNQSPARNFIRFAFDHNKLFGLSSPAIAVTSNRKQFTGKEILFYTLIAILLFFAFIRYSFPKYFIDLFRVAFRTTLKQRQIGEQLIQTPIPSLLLNFFFLISSGLYIDFLLQHFYITNGYNFWLLYFYCCLGLCVIYILKFLSLKFSGWLFNISSTTDGYIFIVFMINKIIGIYLLPFLVLLAFSDNGVYQVAITLSYVGVFALLAYRFVLSYGLIQNQMRLNPFHFFLYLCAFEIVPLLLIYKALLLWF
ncbi:MAG TPA: DUF4271 domain-containing protein [Chitinophagaceae bacterium]